MSSAGPRHVLLMAHGAAESISEIPDYYTHVRGTPPPPALLSELTERYRSIGGSSPLRAITGRVAAQLQTELDRRWGNDRLRVRFGFKHTPPFIEEVVASIVGDGATDILALALAPHYSRFALEGYRHPIVTALEEVPTPPPFRLVPSWHLEPAFVRLWSDRLRAALDRLPPSFRSEAMVYFTAHSLPESMIRGGDPYPVQLTEGAMAIAESAGLSEGAWSLAWQSAGRTRDLWLGPDLREVLRQDSARGRRAAVVVPHGFVCDHLEILYDLDIEARGVADALGLRFERIPMPNDDPRFASMLADVVDRWNGSSDP